MGLDFSIEIRIKDKKTKRVTSIEAAYWRKCYGIRDEVMDVALHTNLIIKYDEDYYLRVKAAAIEPIVDRLTQVLNDHEILGNSIWGYTETRRQTFNNLGQLFDWENFIQEFIAAKDSGEPVIWDEDTKVLCQHLKHQIQECNKIYGVCYDVDLAEKVLKAPNDYKVSIEINNSY